MTLLIFYQNICKASKHAFNIEKFKKFDHRMSRIENIFFKMYLLIGKYTLVAYVVDVLVSGDV